MRRRIIKSSGNVFADLGVKAPEEALVKARLAHVIADAIEERGLTLDDLQHLVWEDEDEDWAEKDSIRLVSRAELADVLADQDVLFNF